LQICSWEKRNEKLVSENGKQNATQTHQLQQRVEKRENWEAEAQLQLNATRCPFFFVFFYFGQEGAYQRLLNANDRSSNQSPSPFNHGFISAHQSGPER